MRKIDSAIVVLDSTQNPYTKINALLFGVLNANKVDIIVAANKTDLPGANPEVIRRALPMLHVVDVSCASGRNIDRLYAAVAEHLH